MKKVIVYFVLLILIVFLLVEFIYIQKYKNQIIELKAKVSILNSSILDWEKSTSNPNSKEFKHALDIKLEECMKKDNYTTASMISCADKSINDWEKEINDNIAHLNQVLNTNQQQILLNSQEKWNDYKKVQWKLNKETLCAKTGTMYQTICIGNDMDIVKQRALELDSLYYFFNR